MVGSTSGKKDGGGDPKRCQVARLGTWETSRLYPNIIYLTLKFGKIDAEHRRIRQTKKNGGPVDPTVRSNARLFGNARRRKIEKAQRSPLLTVASTYRTVSKQALHSLVTEGAEIPHEIGPSLRNLCAGKLESEKSD